MNEGIAAVGWSGLAWSALLVLIVLGLSLWQRLNLERRLLIGCLRTVVQLILIGYLLGLVFRAADWRITALAVAIQLAVAVWTAAGLQNPPLRGARLIALVSLLPSYLVVTAVLLGLIIKAEPWWEPRVVLPLGGMLLGNSLTGVTLALNRYRAELQRNRDLVLARLALGVSWAVAVAEERNDAAYAALLPTITALMTVGLVALPGMMTGQLIAGADPMVAVQYQIVVMLMIAAVVALAVTIALVMLQRRCCFEKLPDSHQGS